MPTAPRILQNAHSIVSLEGWRLDDEFPYGPQGAKPKRILICPNPPPHPFLIGGHRYLFKEPTGSRSQQIWSEVIAYELSRDLGIAVPPAFLAVAPGNGSPGVLIEFFHGFQTDPEYRFVHAIERLQGLQFNVDYRRGSLKDNLMLCRLHKVEGHRAWWARTLAFDALIGNVDRHTENWGFLALSSGDGVQHSLAPAFDNGTSLGFVVRDEDLGKFTQPAEMARLIAKGNHHFGWVAGDTANAQHARLCRVFVDRMGARSAMDDAVELPDARIREIVEWCRGFNFPVPFTQRRGEFIEAQLTARRDALAVALGA